MRSEEWGGLFVDLEKDEEVADKSVIKAVIKLKKIQVNSFYALSAVQCLLLFP